MTIEADIQSLSPTALIELFVIDATSISGGGVSRFHAGTNSLMSDIIWQGDTYSAYPVTASGFELSGRGVMPRPKLSVANAGGLVTALCNDLDDLLGAVVTRKRTLAKYLDSANFAGSPSGHNPYADSTQEFRDEVWVVDRKIEHTKYFITFELAAPFEVEGRKLPGRQVIANACTWTYRSTECGYTGDPVADVNDNLLTGSPRGPLSSDICGKRLSSCRLRFGENATLPYGGFPGVTLI